MIMMMRKRNQHSNTTNRTPSKPIGLLSTRPSKEHEDIPRKLITRSRSITRITHDIRTSTPTRTRQISLDMGISDTMAALQKLRSKQERNDITDLINRLGLEVTHTIQPLRCTHRRPRSASADTRPCPPFLWSVRQPLSTTISTFRTKTIQGTESEMEDTYSESTSNSSCPSSPQPLRAPETTSCIQTMELFAEYMTPQDEADQQEAIAFLNRVHQLSAEFKAHRAYEESTALAWSVQHAAHQGVISIAMQDNLLDSIRTGAWEEARDVLYHKCHLIPAVGLLNDTQSNSMEDEVAIEAFLQCVKQVAPTDTKEMRQLKRQVLEIVSDLLTEWVKSIGFEHGLSEEHAALTRGALYVAGSYRLGLDDPLSDIDVVCAVPWHVTHEDFFTSFCQLLEQTQGVSHLAPVPNAYVPLISLSLHGVSMDLLFSNLPMSCVEAEQEIDSDHILVGMDPASMKSLNAPRVSSMLLCLVPKRRIFRHVLTGIRAWARQRGIYSAKLGYLGGISWSILVAFVCQLYPEADPATVFVRFFQVFSEWPWPRPVMLNIIYDAGLGFEMWDPRQNRYDRAHMMPIITPAYPHMNSAVQVSTSTFSVIYEELWRARFIAEAAMPRLARTISTTVSENPHIVWKQVFERSNFFLRYDSYLIVNFYAATTSSMDVWGQFVRSRLRKLVDSLQHVSGIVRIHAFPQFFPMENGIGECMFIGMESSIMDHEMKTNLERTIRFFLATDLQQLKEKQQDMGADANVLIWSELPSFVFEQGKTNAIVARAEYHEQMERLIRSNPLFPRKVVVQ